MTTTPTAISQEERAKLRNFEAGVGPYLSGRDFAAEIAPRLLDALEVAEAKNERYRKRIQSRFRQLDDAEARAVKAERERNVLAREIMRRGEQSDYDLCPYDGSAKCLYPDSIPCHRSTDGVKECWLEWAEQQAAQGEGENHV